MYNIDDVDVITAAIRVGRYTNMTTIRVGSYTNMTTIRFSR